MQNGKNLVLICPIFFGYYKEIIAAFEAFGFRVFFYSARHSDSFFSKVALRINRHFLPIKRYIYYKRLLNETKKCNISNLIVIDGQGFTKGFFINFRRLHPETKMTLYLWDSLHNFPYFRSFFDSFDDLASFEPADCQNYNMRYVPTFFRDAYQRAAQKDNPNGFKYFASFVGTTRPKKYAFVECVKEDLKARGYDVLTYYYLPSVFLFLLYKLFDRRFRKARIRDFHFKKITNDQVIDLYQQSFAVIDSPPSGQSGITVRCYESIALQRKVITNNSFARSIDKEGTNNVLIYPFSDESLRSFCTSPFSVDEEVLANRSMSSFVRSLLNE